MADKKVTDAAWTLLTSFQEANRIVAEHLAVAQAHNRKLADEFFEAGFGRSKARQANSPVLCRPMTRNAVSRVWTD